MSKKRKALKYAKQSAQAQRNMALSQSLAASAQWRATQAQQQYWAAQQAWANQMARQHWESQQAEAYRRWAAAQPLTCAHCRHASPPGSTSCANCGSRSIAIALPQPPRPAPQPTAKGVAGWIDRATKRG
jgi:hypothetical protein